MLKYLIIPLADNAVSFCRYERATSSKIISLDNLKKIITWSMKENLNIQFLFPDEKLPSSYRQIIDSVDHVSIVASTCSDNSLLRKAEIVVFDSWASINYFPFKQDKRYVIRTTKDDFFNQYRFLKSILSQTSAVVVIITDIDKFSESDYNRYKEILESLVPFVANEIRGGRNIHFNLLTDRISLDKMNNCGAGDETITYSADGKFYICPAFCAKGSNSSVGDLEHGLAIKNSHLYKLQYAPLCRMCDAFQCHRCIWLNQHTTLEVNTPSHEQCVVSHIERNASKLLLKELRGVSGFENSPEIKDIHYLDPFELLGFTKSSH